MKNILGLFCVSAFLFVGCSQEKTSSETITTQDQTNVRAASDSTSEDSFGASPAQDSVLTKAVSFTGAQVTGLTITDNGRMFANFPRWHDSIPFSVVEVLPDGSHKPYPDATWNTWSGQPQANHFTCVQSVVAHGNSLFVLDPASPMMKGVVGTAMLYEFDLGTNKLKNKWSFDKSVAPAASYLNDLRVDDTHGKIYITDSGMGALVVLDPKTGIAKRRLSAHPSVKSEDVWLTVEGKRWVKDGKKPQIHSDGIALSQDDQHLYYHALTGYTLYRVPTAALADDKVTDVALAAKIENLGKTPAPDGMLFDKAGNLYMADLEKQAVVYRTPQGQLKTLYQDPMLKWADTFTLGKDGTLYLTDSRLHEAVGDISKMEFPIYKVKAVGK
ncbi:SMP-30/gluconolactonase/LRE family protein [Rufibacter sediminis]|uniref:SMP-30/gluconolactonase/LRE family protein n=1 Tax=Rufibacter sediminis TaxID=2762756 RepID=A0ABR6VSV1_9BACT|nr:L-dopachrome tautomerase-related protein [Rufibacter sediminis]MBC3539962.1 SMP-30/gluconolactonase/LRE family protein [Rufibacter sediminis]